MTAMHTETPGVLIDLTRCDGCGECAAACATGCPSGATVQGPREELLAEAHARIRGAPGRYCLQVYGEDEAGDAPVLFLAPPCVAPPGCRGDEETLPELTWSALRSVPGGVAGGGAVLFAIWSIARRRFEVAAAQAAAKRAAHARLRARLASGKETGHAV
jgi:ferredoxin